MFARWDVALPAITFITTATTDQNVSSFDFGSLSIGPERGDRVVIVSVGLIRPSGLIGTPSLTINGAAAALQAFEVLDSTYHAGAAIFSLRVPSGTTASFVLSSTFTFGPDGYAVIAIYSATGLLSPTATNAAVDNVSPISLSLPVQANGIAVAIGSTANNTGESWSWAGATENFDLSLMGAVSGATNVVTGATTLSISGTTGGFAAGCGASFR